jgi:hypothetical protein
MGYTVDHVQPGRGYSCVEHAHKEFPNGRSVFLTTRYPGLFDGLAGLSTDITEEYEVWLGWEEYDKEVEDNPDAPPPGGLELPAGATKWKVTAYEGPMHWWAVFEDGDLAEAFCAGLPPPCELDEIALTRLNVRPQ